MDNTITTLTDSVSSTTDFTPILEKLDIINSNLNVTNEVLLILLGALIAGFVALSILKGVTKNV